MSIEGRRIKKASDPGARAYQAALNDESPEGVRKAAAMREKAARTRKERAPQYAQQRAAKKLQEAQAKELEAISLEEVRDRRAADVAREMVDRGVLAIDPETGEYRTIYEEPQD